MKQKIVIDVCLNDNKSCSKAMQTAVKVDGVVQAAVQREKNQIEVTGEEIDVVLLVRLLRKRLKHANVHSVSPVEPKKPEPKKPPTPESPKPVLFPNYHYVPALPPCAYFYHDSPSCPIM